MSPKGIHYGILYQKRLYCGAHLSHFFKDKYFWINKNQVSEKFQNINSPYILKVKKVLGICTIWFQVLKFWKVHNIGVVSSLKPQAAKKTQILFQSAVFSLWLSNLSFLEKMNIIWVIWWFCRTNHWHNVL